MGRRLPTWPVYLLALPAAVSIWAGWVGLGRLTGFGRVQLLPGIWDSLILDTAITLPIGMEAYAAYALKAWLTPSTPQRARTFAKRSAIGALMLGAGGQVAYHLMAAAGMQSAPWQITTIVACIPVAVLGMGATLAHLLSQEDDSVTEAVPITQRLHRWAQAARQLLGDERAAPAATVPPVAATPQPAADQPSAPTVEIVAPTAPIGPPADPLAATATELVAANPAISIRAAAKQLGVSRHQADRLLTAARAQADRRAA